MISTGWTPRLANVKENLTKINDNQIALLLKISIIKVGGHSLTEHVESLQSAIDHIWNHVFMLGNAHKERY